jgi:hypothetical protein
MAPPSNRRQLPCHLLSSALLGRGRSTLWATPGNDAEMDTWEHRTVLIPRREGVWAVEFADGQTLEGIDRILDEYGGRGWELVSLVAQTWTTGAGQFGPFDVSAYRAVFKRRLGAQAAQPLTTETNAAMPASGDASGETA